MFKSEKGFTGIVELIALTAFIVTLMVSGASIKDGNDVSQNVKHEQVVKK